MGAFNVVRYRVKQGMDDKVLEVHHQASFNFPGFRRGNLIKTGESTYCFIGEWDSAAAAAEAESGMIEILNQFSDTLEELDSGKKTDAVFGDSVIDY